MASFTLKLSDDTLRKLTEAARKADVTPARMAAVTLEAWLPVVNGPNRSPAGVGEPERAWTTDTKGDGPGQHTTPESDDGPFVDMDVTLDALGTAKLTARAKRMGISPEELATIALDSQFFDDGDFQWPEGGDPREDNAANYDLNEVGRPWSEVRPEFMTLIDKTFGEPE